MEEARLQVAEYRLDKVEELIGDNISQMSKKLDTIIDTEKNLQTNLATYVANLKAVENQVAEIKAIISTNTQDINSLQVTLAEKLGPGAVAGAASAVVVFLIKSLAGV